MSKITDLMNAVRTMAQAAVPNSTRLFDPVVLERNPEMFLRAGWGVRLGESEDEDDTICNDRYNESITVGVVFTRECPALDSDPATREDEQGLLLEDSYSMRRMALQDLTLGGLAIEFKFIGSEPVQEVFGNEQKPYVYRVSNYKIRYTQII